MRPTHLHQHPDGMVRVLTPAGTYIDTSENFAKDAGIPVPMLPENVTERLYEPGIRHPLISDHDVVDGGPIPWPEGDAIIAKVTELLAAQKGRQLTAKT